MATKTKPKPKPKPSRDLQQATAEAAEKYGPEISQIQGLFGQAKSQLTSDIESAKAGSKSAELFARNALPGVKDIYRRAGTATANAQSDVADTFSKIGPAADAFRAATAREQSGAKTRIAGSGARAEQSLTDRQQEAIAGRAFAINQARASYGKTSDTLSDRLRDIAGAQGASIAARLGALGNERLTRQNRKDVARIQTGSAESIAAAKIKAAAERDAAKDKKDKDKKNKPPRATLISRTNLSDAFGEAVRIAKALNDKKEPRSGAAAKLVLGTTIPPGDTSGTRPIPKTRELVASLALDMAYDGHISKRNAERLHKAGYKVSDIEGALSRSDYDAYLAEARANNQDRPGGRGA